jgi:hypothetical protein
MKSQSQRGSDFSRATFAVGISILFSTRAVGDPSAHDLILGSWDPGGDAFYNLPINVESDLVVLAECPAMPYLIIRDRAGHGPGHIAGASTEWREIAIEIRPKTQKQAKCSQWRVLDFSIPLDMTRHADIALFTSRSAFDNDQDYIAWGVWGKDD